MRKPLLAFLLLGSVSCGDLVRQGTASSYLIVNSLLGAAGDLGTVRSDVLTGSAASPSIVDDLGRVQFQLAMKDAGPIGSPSAPSPNNYITITRYRVEFVRADGRNTPGVDVPYTFDGAFTLTVTESSASVDFPLVRHQAKAEAPLAALSRSPVIISTIARVTFYGRDQTGREVSTTAQIGVNFGDFADAA
ncbi:MAG: hypothetical protein H0W08_14635 [Acidobacteria bacterium]|nr:hypothetical protein [Acidobacteriota bacterium]